MEVDTKADFEQFTSSGGYYYGKSEALLNFGVKKVIWIFTDAKKVMIAEPDKDWLVHGLHYRIPLDLQILKVVHMSVLADSLYLMF